MQKRIERRLPVLLVLCLLTAGLLLGTLRENSRLSRLNQHTITDTVFRRQQVNDTVIKYLQTLQNEERGKVVGLYLLDKDSQVKGAKYFSADNLSRREQLWKKSPSWNTYRKICDALWNDVIYFPIPQSTKHKEYGVTYVDSWMSERTFGGKRGHEGCDLIASKDRPGLFPVVSMTDGVIVSKGWLTKGGYRIGVQAPSGAYFYYAHLDSYSELQKGDEILAGDILGFMGNSGYGAEGTKGMFATHLHLGIYLYPQNQEVSYNPYWILRMIEEKKLSCSF